jgi:hypothetical protein
MVQQLNINGGNGFSDAQLEQAYAEFKQQSDLELAKFAKAHGDAFVKLKANKDIDAATMLQIASSVNASGMSKEEVDTQVEQMLSQTSEGMTSMIKDTFLKEMLPWTLIPGWGAIRFAASPLFGGKDPISKRPIHMDFWNHGLEGWLDAALAAGGAVTVANNVRGAMQVSAGHRLIAAGGDAAKIAANEGVANLRGFGKFLSYVPGTNANRVVSGISRLDSSLTSGISKLTGVERELAENVLTKWRAGQLSIVGDGAVKVSKMGVISNSRGMLPMIGQRGKAMAATGVFNGKAAITLDLRMSGKSLAAHLASAGVEHADGALKSRLLSSFGISGGGALSKEAITGLRTSVLGSATQQLTGAGVLARPTGLQGLLGTVRPGPVQDAFKAAGQVSAGTVGVKTGLAALSRGGKFGLGALAAAAVGGLGYQFMVKPQMAAAQQAAAGASEQQQQAGQQVEGQPQAQQQVDPSGSVGVQTQQPQAGVDAQQGAAMQIDAQMEQAITVFAQLQPAEQQALIEQQYAALQQAAAQPNLTPEQQAQIQAGVQELQIFMQVAQQMAQQAAPQTVVQ